LIDLHTHTTASDGQCTPADLAATASACGVRVLGVTDHDTVSGCLPAADACRRLGLEFVTGIEITAVVDDLDVHVLGYFLDPLFPPLLAFLAEQRYRRIHRIEAIIDRLASHGVRLDRDAILGPALADTSKAIGRPSIARALVAAGHVPDTGEAFERWLAHGRPAFIPRMGPPPEEVIAAIHAAGGLASLAHPGLLNHDDWIPGYAGAGLDALEAYHSEHDSDETSRYVALSSDLGLALTGGSDYHGDASHGEQPGSVSLPAADYARLKGLRPTRRASASGASTSS
jgi:predicted metal-dependent phosphoesterase TrpH